MSINHFTERVSVRDFDGQPLPEADLKLIIEAINNTPTSTNAQQFSAMIITDAKLKDFIATKNWNQAHIRQCAAFILFFTDRTGMHEIFKAKNIVQSLEAIQYDFFRAIIDATIASTYAQDAILSLGYGVTMVGGIHTFADELAKMLNLPDNAVLINALSFGKATRRNAIKPKINKVFINQYDQGQRAEATNEYNKATSAYFLSTIKRDYFTDVAGYAQSSAFSEAGKYFMKKLQGFK